MSEAEVATLADQRDVALLDLRRPEAFGRAHIANAINIGAGQNLSLWADWLLDASKQVIVINDIGDDEVARRSLIRLGIDKVIGFLAKGMPAWIDIGRILRVRLRCRRKRCSGHAETLVLNVRSDREGECGQIEGAQHIMLRELAKNVAFLLRNRAVITVCGSGYRSSIAASLLEQCGLGQVSSMDGGMSAWHRQQLPTGY